MICNASGGLHLETSSLLHSMVFTGHVNVSWCLPKEDALEYCHVSKHVLLSILGVCTEEGVFTAYDQA